MSPNTNRGPAADTTGPHKTVASTTAKDTRYSFFQVDRGAYSRGRMKSATIAQLAGAFAKPFVRPNNGTPESIAQAKRARGGFVGARIANGHRCAANLEAVTVLHIDYDQRVPADFVERVSGLGVAYLVHTSYSATEAGPKSHVYLFPGRELTVDEAATLRAHYARQLGQDVTPDPTSDSVSQQVFLPVQSAPDAFYRVEWSDELAPIDVDAVLAVAEPVTVKRTSADTAAGVALLDGLDPDEAPCSAVAAVVDRMASELAEAEAHHPWMRGRANHLVLLAIEGHRGVAQGLEALRAVYLDTFPDRGAAVARTIEGAAAVQVTAKPQAERHPEGLCGALADFAGVDFNDLEAPSESTSVEVENPKPLGAAVLSQMHAQTQFAHALAAKAADRHMHVARMGWHYWDGKRWQLDDEGKRVRAGISRQLAEIIAANLGDADVHKAVRSCSSANGLDGVARVASTIPALSAGVDDLDASPTLLNVANGVLDLETFELAAHDPARRLTKVTRGRYVEGLDWQHTRWGRFLEQMVPDPEVRGYLQRHAGVSLLGEVLEHTLLILTGSGRNGKGVFYSSVNWAMGDYADVMDPELLMSRDKSSAGLMAAKMTLRGLRRVTASETERGRRMSASTVKALAGGDRIQAKFMGQNPVTFEPTHSAVLVTNHLPSVPADDPALWARLKVVEWGVVLPDDQQDRALPQKMHAEADAVLSWAIEGLKEYRRVGMAEPEAVSMATAAYREEADDLGAWLTEETQPTAKPVATITELHTAFTSWCQRNRAETVGRKTFSTALSARGIKVKRTASGFAAYLELHDDWGQIT